MSREKSMFTEPMGMPSIQAELVMPLAVQLASIL
jgi:hypothetical protein